MYVCDTQVSTAVTVEFPDVEDGETKGEHVPLRLIGKEEKKDKAKGEQVSAYRYIIIIIIKV